MDDRAPRTPDERDHDAADRDIAAGVRDRLSDPDDAHESEVRREAARDRWEAMNDRQEARRDRKGDGDGADQG